MSEVKNDFGIVIDGQFHAVDWIPRLVDSLSKKVMRNIMDKIEEELNQNPLESTKHRNYTVKEVAALTKRAHPTITRHIRIGLLKASKVGKSWLISEENYQNYKNNAY
jgi:excisionase family DNA binding protein